MDSVTFLRKVFSETIDITNKFLFYWVEGDINHVLFGVHKLRSLTNPNTIIKRLRGGKNQSNKVVTSTRPKD